MTTIRKSTSGPGSQGADSISSRDAYEKNSRKVSVGNFMRTFARTKTAGIVETWDDIDFLSVKGTHPMFINHGTGSVSSSSVGSTAMLALIDLAWETYFSNANLKDLVAAEELSWKTYFCLMFQLCADLQIQYNFRTILPAYTEADGTPGGTTNIPYYSQSSFDILVASMKEFPVPKGIYELVDTFFTWLVKLGPEYEKFSLRIPPTMFSPFNSYYDLADHEGMRGGLRINIGNAITHAKKFGLKMGKWRDPVAPKIKTVDDPDVIAYLNHSFVSFYGNTPGVDILNPNGGYMGANRTTNFTGVEYYFKDTPNESPIHVLSEFFGYNQGANALYSEILITGDVVAAEYNIDVIHVAEHGTSMAAVNLATPAGTYISHLFKAVHDGNSAIFQLFSNGTNFTAPQLMDGSWPLAGILNLFKGTGRGANENENDIVNYVGKLLV